MKNTFKIKLIKPDECELQDIGFDCTYIKKGLEKHKFVSVKIYGLSSAQANILKQTALSTGTDCAVHREVITGKVDKSDCILSGSCSQFKKISEKLQYQPFKLFELGKAITELIYSEPAHMVFRDKIFTRDHTYIMGIVNATPDSFSDGGLYLESEKAIEHALNLIQDGADIIDIGGESTRPYSKQVPPEEEISRIIPVIKGIREINKGILISIDTRNAKTAKLAFEAGADIINDVSACEWDKDMIQTVKDLNMPVILNHSKGTPENMQNETEYINLADDIYNYFSHKTEQLQNEGIPLSNIIIDVGIGFGKNTEQNYELIKKISQFKSLGCALMVGHSRKSFLQETLKTKDNESLDIATNAVSYFLLKECVDIIRVHNVKNAKILTEVYKNLSL